MKKNIPKKMATIGGVLIALSGLLNVLLGIQIGAWYYEVYPGGNMGHVGILAGVAAVVLGLAIIFVIAPLYNKGQPAYHLLAGILTIVLGHIGAIAGAIFVGTLGAIMCYIGGIWILWTGIQPSLPLKSRDKMIKD